jgi:AcrR family transcriptional regulator
MSKENDLRIIKTHKLIREAFIKLIDIKGFKKITVNDIADFAMINRSTFYLHYSDKYDLLQQTTEEAIQKIMRLIDPKEHIIDGKLDYGSFVHNINHILTTIEKDALLYKIILNDKEMLGVNEKLENDLYKKLGSSFAGHILISQDLFLELLISQYVSAIRWWLNNDMKYSSHFMAEQLVKIITAGPCCVSGILTL